MLALAVSRRNSIWCRITCTWSRRKARNTTNKAFCHFCSSLPSLQLCRAISGGKFINSKACRRMEDPSAGCDIGATKKWTRKLPAYHHSVWHDFEIPSDFGSAARSFEGLGCRPSFKTHTKCHPQGFLTTFVTQINHVNTCRLHSTLTFGHFQSTRFRAAG